MTDYKEIDGYIYQVDRQESGRCRLQCVGIVNQLIAPKSLEITGKEDFNGAFYEGWYIYMLPGQVLIDETEEAKQLLSLPTPNVKLRNASLSGRHMGEKDPDEIPLYTPPLNWRVKGEKDPHEGRYDCERAELTLGYLTDDELANGAFMNYDRPLDVNKILDRTTGYHSPIAWMTAVKDRIRWLSRSLVKATSNQNDDAVVNHTLDIIDERLDFLYNKKTYNDQDKGYNKAIGHVSEFLRTLRCTVQPQEKTKD